MVPPLAADTTTEVSSSRHRSRGDLALARAAAAGDAAAFEQILDRHHPLMLRLARCVAADPASAADVARDAWMSALGKLDRYDGSTTLRTWVAGFLTDAAPPGRPSGERSRPVRDAAFTAGGDADGAWSVEPQAWDLAIADATRPDVQRVIGRAIAELPTLHRQVVTLRDVEGWSAAEVSHLLAISEFEQRRVLHQARLDIRDALDVHYCTAPVPVAS